MQRFISGAPKFAPDADMPSIYQELADLMEVSKSCYWANVRNRCDTLFGRRHQS